MELTQGRELTIKIKATFSRPVKVSGTSKRLIDALELYGHNQFAREYETNSVSWRSVRHIIRWSLTAAVRDADIWHLSDDLSFPEALAEARREQFPYLVQRRLLFSKGGRLMYDSGNSLVRVAGVPLRAPISHPWRVECLRCSGSAQFGIRREAEWWRDVHEFENQSDGHIVRVLLQTDRCVIDMADVIVLELDRDRR